MINSVERALSARSTLLITENEGMTTLMWEAKASAGRQDDLVAHVLHHADPQAQVYRSDDERVVVIDPTGRGIAEVPGELVARPPHVWPFTAVPR